MPRDRINIQLTEFQSIYKQLQTNLHDRIQLNIPKKGTESVDNTEEKKSGIKNEKEEEEEDELDRANIEQLLENSLFNAMAMVYQSLDVEGIDPQYEGKPVAFHDAQLLQQTTESNSVSLGAAAGDEPLGTAVSLKPEESVDIRCVLLSEEEREVEPFDQTLSEAVRQKYQDWEDEVMRVTHLRKSGPLELKKEYRTVYDAYLQEIDAQVESSSMVLDNLEEVELDADRDTELQQMNMLATSHKKEYTEGLRELYEAKEHHVRAIEKRKYVIDKKKKFISRELNKSVKF